MLKKILPALIVGVILAPIYVQLFSLYNNNILKIIVTVLYFDFWNNTCFCLQKQ